MTTPSLPALPGYRFNGSDYVKANDYARLGSHLERVRSLMIDGQWRTRQEVVAQTGLPVNADITKQIRHLRYPEHGAHRVDKRHRGAETSGLWEYRMHPAGTHRDPGPTAKDEELRRLRLTVELLADALGRLAPDHPVLHELDL